MAASTKVRLRNGNSSPFVKAKHTTASSRNGNAIREAQILRTEEAVCTDSGGEKPTNRSGFRNVSRLRSPSCKLKPKAAAVGDCTWKTCDAIAGELTNRCEQEPGDRSCE